MRDVLNMSSLHTTKTPQNKDVNDKQWRALMKSMAEESSAKGKEIFGQMFRKRESNACKKHRRKKAL